MKTAQKSSIRNAVKFPIGKHTGTFYSFHGLTDGKEHIAIGFEGTNKDKNQPPLVRIHSECLTGDIFSSHRCDCGEQLSEALDKIAAQGGYLLYLRQEGRGIGLYNKLDAYELQLQGLDTFAANRKLGLEDDLRDYEVAAQMLNALNVKSIKLLSNNPDKRNQLESFGIQVISNQTTGIFIKEQNYEYLFAKKEQGHLINLQPVMTEFKQCYC